MEKEFYRQVVRELLPRIRKPRSQGQIARVLGVGAKRISDWEAGRKSISWRDFGRFCAAAGISLADSLRDCSSLPSATGLADAPVAFRRLAGSGTPVEIATRLGFSVDRTRRLLRRQATATTSELLQALHRSGAGFFVWLGRLARGEDLPVFADRMRRHRAQAALYAEAPWTSLIATALASPEARSVRDGIERWVAARTRLSAAGVREGLRRMAEAGLIEPRDGAYALLPLESFAPAGNPDDLRRGVLYWAALASAGIAHGYGQPRCRASWSVFNLSDVAHAKLQVEMNQFRRTMGAIIDADARASAAEKRTYLYSFTCVDLAHVPEGVADGLGRAADRTTTSGDPIGSGERAGGTTRRRAIAVRAAAARDSQSSP